MFARIWIVALVVLCGCMETKHYDDVRVSVSGKITLDGKPIENGTIFFDPAGSDLRSSGAKIVNGSYMVETKHGPNPGKYSVRFSVKQPTGDFRVIEDGEEEEVLEEILPKKFLRATGITQEFERGDNTFDYDINTDTE